MEESGYLSSPKRHILDSANTGNHHELTKYIFLPGTADCICSIKKLTIFLATEV